MNNGSEDRESILIEENELNQPQQQTKPTFPPQISLQFFSKVSDLSLIESPFSISNISSVLAQRSTSTQFQLLRLLTQTKKHKLQLRVNSILQNKKNRYPQQSIYENTRVLGFNSSYVNANWTNEGVIVGQGPLQSTIEQVQYIWRREKVQCIMMLCNIIQNGRVKCWDYLEGKDVKVIKNIDLIERIKLIKDAGDSKIHKNWQNVSNYINNESIVISEITLPEKGCWPLQKLLHIHFTVWEDKSVPTVESLHALMTLVLPYSSIFLHCSAGLGRSGVVAVLLDLLRTDKQISVFGSVRKIRERRYGAVQNSEQYSLIYRYLEYKYTLENR